MMRITLRSVVAVIGLALLATVVFFTTTSGGLALGLALVLLVVAILYYGGYNMDRLLKGDY